MTLYQLSVPYTCSLFFFLFIFHFIIRRDMRAFHELHLAR